MAGYQGTATRGQHLEALAAAIEAERREVLTTVRGAIVAYDPVTQRASVQPLMTARFGDETLRAPVLESVPVMQPRGGGYAAHFPLKAGDPVTLHVFSRGHDRALADGSDANLRPGRMHELSDAVAYPGGHADTQALAGMNGQGAHFGSDDGKRGIQARDDGTTAVVGGPDGGDKLRVDAAGRVDLTANGESLLAIIREFLVIFRDHTNQTLPLDGVWAMAASQLIARIDGMKAS